MRSAIGRTSFSLWVMNSTEWPDFWSDRMIENRSSVSCGVSTAVGSSRISSRASRSSAWISPSATVRSMPSLATTPGNRLVIPLSSSFKLPPQGGPRGGSSRSGPPRPCALLVVLRLHRDRARDDALLDGVDVVLELLGHLAVEVVVRGDADAVVLQGADVGAALELVVDGALDGRLDRDVHVLLDAGQEQAAVLLRALAAVGVHP